MRKTLILIVGLAVFLWTTDAGSQTQSQTQQQTTNQACLRQHALQDANGDGICDHCGNPVGSGKANAQGKAAKNGKHWGPGDGTGYGAQSGQKMGPHDGTGWSTSPGAMAGGGHGHRGCRR